MMKHIIFFVLLFLAASSVFSFGRREKKAQPPQPEPNTNIVETTITILGSVRIFGNEPFTFVGIVDENGIEYAVHPPSVEDELRGLQGHTIEFTAVLLDEPQGYGSLFLKGGTVTPVVWEIQ
jgi:heme/copper-type cytochrome/quinol oxidase subunit 2